MFFATRILPQRLDDFLKLLYTTFITSTCVVVAVLSLIGVNFNNGLSVTGWIALNCESHSFQESKPQLTCISGAFISLLSIHSFGRVVHRHEREALLTHPVTSTAIRRAANDIVNQHSRRQALSNGSRVSDLRTSTGSNMEIFENPFADSKREQTENPFISVLEEPDSLPAQNLLRSQTTEPNYLRLQPSRSNSRTSPQDLDFSRAPTGPVGESPFSMQQVFSQSWVGTDTSPVSNYSTTSMAYQQESISPPRGQRRKR